MERLLFTIIIFCILLSNSISQELSNGKLVKSRDSDHIYLIFNGKVHHIPDMMTYNRLFIENPKQESFSLLDLEVLPKGHALDNARLIKAGSSAVYLQYGDFKHHIISPETFNDFQFDWNKIVLVKDEDLFRFQTLSPITIIQNK